MADPILLGDSGRRHFSDACLRWIALRKSLIRLPESSALCRVSYEALFPAIPEGPLSLAGLKQPYGRIVFLFGAA